MEKAVNKLIIDDVEVMYYMYKKQIKVPNILVGWEITSSWFSAMPICVYSQPHAHLLLSHMCIYVLPLFKHRNLRNNFGVYQDFLLNDFNHSLMVLKQLLSILHVSYSASTR